MAGSWSGLSTPLSAKNKHSPIGGRSIRPNNNLYVHQGVSRLESDIELGSDVWTGQARGKQEVEYRTKDVVAPEDVEWPRAPVQHNV